MVLLADGSLFFNEWYWEPLWRTLVAVPFLGIAAFVTAIAVRRWIPAPGPRILLAVGIIVVGTAWILFDGLTTTDRW
jgi:hypothetical protein